MDVSRTEVDIFEFLNLINTFEHNEDCTVRIDNGGIFNEPRIKINTRFKNKHGRKCGITYELTKRQVLNFRGKSIYDVIKDILYHSIKPDMDEAKGLHQIDWDLLMLKAKQRDYIREPIIKKDKKNKNKIRIYTHIMPSYDGDDYIDYDEWHSLYCEIEDGVITDTYGLDSKYLNYKVMDFNLNVDKYK